MMWGQLFCFFFFLEFIISEFLSHRKLDYLKTFIFIPPVSVLSVIYSIHSCSQAWEKVGC